MRHEGDYSRLDLIIYRGGCRWLRDIVKRNIGTDIIHENGYMRVGGDSESRSLPRRWAHVYRECKAGHDENMGAAEKVKI